MTIFRGRPLFLVRLLPFSCLLRRLSFWVCGRMPSICMCVRCSCLCVVWSRTRPDNTQTATPVYVTLYRWPFGVQVCTYTPIGHLYRVTYTRCRIDTINSPDHGHMAARNMQRIEINLYKKELCVRLVIYKDCTNWLHKIIDAGETYWTLGSQHQRRKNRKKHR
jgi:hypothetical protein